VNTLAGIGSGAWEIINNIGAVIVEKAGAIAGWGKGVASGIKSGLVDGLTNGLKAIKEAVERLFGKVIGWVERALGIGSPSKVFYDIGQNTIRGFIHGVGSMGGILKKAVTGMVHDAVGAVTSLPGKVFGPRGGGTPSSFNERLGKQLASTFGWGSGAQWNALDALFTGESGWSNTAKNASSGAYGIAQALPQSKYPPAGRESGGSDAATQIAWGLRYIRDRYGSPLNAYNAWLSRSPHWYGEGGIFTKPTIIGVGERGPEAVVPLGKAGRGGDINIYLTNQGVLGSEAQVTAWLRNAIAKLETRNGRPF
jgi:hypothetical protein